MGEKPTREDEQDAQAQRATDLDSSKSNIEREAGDSGSAEPQEAIIKSKSNITNN